jgi:serine/threonine-protein kinase
MTSCPSHADLRDLLAERLAADQEKQLLAHVENCPACQHRLEELTAFGGADPRAPGAPDEPRPPGDPTPETGSFWRELKAAPPCWPSTIRGEPAERPAGAAAAAAALPARLGRYALLEEIGRGGMGTVLRGYDPDLGRDLAVKVLLPDKQHDLAVVSRFTEEAQIGGQLQHPGIVPVYELGRSADQRPYFAMKLVKGRTLASLLQERTGPTDDLPRCIGIFEQVCQTLAYAHSHGVLHRDLKPANIMLGAFGEVQVMDWGLAKVLRPREGTTAEGTPSPPTGMIHTVRTGPQGPASHTGEALGTPAYMAPEQARGEVDRLDQRADVFGLGALLCEILTGHPPFTAASAHEVLARAMHADLDDAWARLQACGADPELVQLARTCLASDPAGRPSDAGVVAGAVTAYRHSVAQRLRRAELERAQAQVQAREERKRRRLTVGLATALLALVMLGVGAGWWLQRQAAQRRQAAEAALARVAELRQDGRWGEAQGVLDHAAKQLGDAGPDDLRGQLHQAQADLKLVTRLDSIRQQRATWVKAGFDNRTADRDYAVAFAEAGLAREGEAPERVARRIHVAALKKELVAALDDWAAMTPDRKRRGWLLAVARRADPDPWRDHFRDPVVRRDRRALQKLADEAVKANAVGVGKLTPQVLAALGLALHKMKADAVPLLTAAQHRYPADFWLNFELGAALLQAKRPGEAVGYYRAALALRPQALAVHTNLGNALKDLGRYGEALGHYRHALRLAPQFALTHHNLAAILQATGLPDQAIDHFREALRLDPTFSLAHIGLGNALFAKGQRDQAIRHYRQALRLDPKSATAHTNLGAVLKNQGRLGPAIDHFRRALRIAPEFAPAHANLGLALKDKGCLNGAIRHFRQALRCNPKLASAHTYLGVALKNQGRLDQAIQHFHQALALAPQSAEAHTNLGNALHDQGRLKEALDHHRQAVRIAPGLAAAHNSLGNALYGLGRRDEALRHYRRALALNPQFAYAHINLGLAYLREANFTRARAALRRGLKFLPPGDPLRPRSTLRFRQCDRFLVLEKHLPAILRGEAQPTDAAEQLEYARLCNYKQLHRASARFFAAAAAANSELAKDPATGNRYSAACSAALAGNGQGHDAGRLDAAEGSRWRQQALVWLRADFDLGSKQLRSGKREAVALVQRQMRLWQQDVDLTGVRDPEALAKLPAAERQAWSRFWSEVADRLKK